MSVASPQRASIADRSLAMFVPCLAGMATGLAIDCASVHPEALASLCTSSDDVLIRAWVHWKLMPAAHVLMLAGAMLGCMIGESRNRLPVGIGMRIGVHGMCLLAMTAGMIIGAQLGPRFSASSGLSSFTGLTTMMVAGMAIGMAAAMPLECCLRRVGMRRASGCGTDAVMSRDSSVAAGQDHSRARRDVAAGGVAEIERRPRPLRPCTSLYPRRRPRDSNAT